MLRFVALFALVALASAGTLVVDPCPGNDAQTGTITEVYSANFTDGAEVVLNKGSTYSFGIRFTAAESSPQLEPTIYGIISGIQVGWNGVNKAACNDLVDANKCPLIAGRSYHYIASIEVLNTYPSTRLTFQWGLTAKSAAGVKGKNHACFRMPAQIK